MLLFAAPLVSAQTIVQGTVRDRIGSPVADATVELTRSSSSPVASWTTGADGRFLFKSIEPGEYRIRAVRPSFYPAFYEFVLRQREPVELEIVFQKEQSASEKVEVRVQHLTIDLQKTGSSYTFTNKDLGALPDPMVESTNDLANNLMPGASDSHDNFLAVRGTEFSLHEFINGVSFLDNMQPHLNVRGATLDNYDLNADYGGKWRQLGYYFFADGFTSGRYLDPPEPKELYDFGKASRATAQFDWQTGASDTFKLLLMGSGSNFEQPNIGDDEEAGRDAQRHLRQQTAILTWLHTLSPESVLNTSIYERTSSDRVLPTTDPITPLSTASRAPLTLGIKSDLMDIWHGHVFKAGVDLFRVRELESFFFDSRGDPDVFPAFQGGLHGGEASAYAQDHFSLTKNLWVDAGLRYDYFDLVDTRAQFSPRVGLAYHIVRTKSVVHAAYNHYFSPPPIEYSLLASFIGHNAMDVTQRVGDVRAYTQNYFEAGWSQELHPQVSLEVTLYRHTGHNAFENHEISISRIFVPVNFHSASSEGAEAVLNIRNLERLGISARLQYSLAKTYFYGPITGGFAGDEPLVPGERIIPAFDQTHTGTAQLFYRSRWRGMWTGIAMRYGRGTIVENGPRLPQHFTSDLGAGTTLWHAEPRWLELEFDVTNVSNSVYQIAKES
ncbi:MAG: hypothetical protein DMG95_13575, partial [Acidobacteria bacterium]